MVSGLFGKPKMPEPIVVAAPPDDTGAKEAAARLAASIKKRRARASTIKTSEEGLTAPATTLKTTLG